MPAIDIHQEKDSVTAAQKAAEAIGSILAGYAGNPVLFLVSGGSPLEILKYLSADPFDVRLTVGVSDERWSTDPSVNNFAQVITTPWYASVTKKGSASIDTRPASGETVEEAGRRFDAALKTWKQANPAGKIVITQGIGLDGHTAGMMPYPEDERAFGFLFDDSDVWAVGYDAKEKNKYPLRVTTTLPFLRFVDDSIVFVCGQDKKEPLARVLAPDGALAATPGRIIHQMKHCLLFTDLTL